MDGQAEIRKRESSASNEALVVGTACIQILGSTGAPSVRA